MSESPYSSSSQATVSLADEETTLRVVTDTVFGLWTAVNNLTRLRPSRRTRYRVTIFGSARTKPGHWAYEEVRRMAAGLTTLGCDIVTGGGPGLMEAANQGARQAQGSSRTQSTGIRVDLPFEQESNAFVEQAYVHQTFFTRLHHFVLMSDAYVVVPGGIGTALESLMVWQLLQVRHLHDTPLVFVGAMWGGLVDWARTHMLRPGEELISAPDLEIPRCVNGADEAIAIIREHHARWQSDAGVQPAEERTH